MTQLGAQASAKRSAQCRERTTLIRTASTQITHTKHPANTRTLSLEPVQGAVSGFDALHADRRRRQSLALFRRANTRSPSPPLDNLPLWLWDSMHYVTKATQQNCLQHWHVFPQQPRSPLFCRPISLTYATTDKYCLGFLLSFYVYCNTYQRPHPTKLFSCENSLDH